MRQLLIVMLLILTGFACADVAYLEEFDGSGEMSVAGWNSYLASYSSDGIYDSFAWVWHNGICRNLIYTTEAAIEVDSSTTIEFQYDLRMFSSYSSTPYTSIVVQVGGSWYVSKTTFTSTSTSFATQSLTYNPAKENWDVLYISTPARGDTPDNDLSGNITGFGLYSNSVNYEGSCTAEYDNFTIITTQQNRSADFDESGVVDIADLAALAEAWNTSNGDLFYNQNCDLDFDNSIETDDLLLFADDWLAGAVYPYTSVDSPRKKLAFNTGWLFHRGDVNNDNAKNTSYNDSHWDTVSVPHAPVITDLRVQWPGPDTVEINWYRKHFTVDSNYEGCKIFIEFEAVDQVAEVWVNGTKLTTHYGAYLPFTIDVTDYVNFGAADNVIAVKANESEDDDIPFYGLWLSSGGIYRDVWMHITEPIHVTDAVYAGIEAGGGIFVTYPSVSTTQAQVQIKTHVLNENISATECTVASYIVNDDNMVVAEAADTTSISSGSDNTFTQSVTVMSPKLWHPNSPNLYTLYTHVYDGSELVDIYQTRIGIRSIEFTLADGFKINDEIIKLRGANRVQDYPYIGWAAGNLSQKRDAKLLKEAGFDYIRTSHYPMDPAFMDACDELGIVILDEIPGFQYVGETTFKNRSYQTMRDMIRRDRNHPCVIAWELSLNETSFDYTYAQNAMAIGHAEYPGDQCYVAAWAHDSVYDIYIATPNAGARSYSGSTPMIVSEHGHWEYGGNSSTSDVHRANTVTADSYSGGEAAMLQQAWNHQESHHINRGLSNMCADGVWVGIDYGAWPSGVYDFLRLPKFSAYFWKSQRGADIDLSSQGVESGPMVKIANYWSSSSPTDVTVYSNCEQVKLYINNVLLATKSPDSGYPTANLLCPPFTFAGLTYSGGQLKAEGLIDGVVVASDIVRTAGAASSIEIEFDNTDVPANGSETLFVYASIVDSNGTVVTNSSGNITFSVTGQAKLLTPSTIKAEAGIATAIIQATDVAGNITVAASATGGLSGSGNITTE